MALSYTGSFRSQHKNYLTAHATQPCEPHSALQMKNQLIHNEYFHIKTTNRQIAHIWNHSHAQQRLDNALAIDTIHTSSQFSVFAFWICIQLCMNCWNWRLGIEHTHTHQWSTPVHSFCELVKSFYRHSKNALNRQRQKLNENKKRTNNFSLTNVAIENVRCACMEERNATFDIKFDIIYAK